MGLARRDDLGVWESLKNGVSYSLKMLSFSLTLENAFFLIDMMRNGAGVGWVGGETESTA